MIQEGGRVSQRARVLVSLLVILVLGGAAAIFAISAARATSVRVATVAREDLAITVAGSGKVEADQRIDVFPPTSGTLESVEVTDGQLVKAGQVLAVMDEGPIEVQVKQAEASYQGAIAQRNTVAKSSPGPSDRAAAQAAVDAAYSAYQMANAQYEAAKAGLGAPTPADIANAQSQLALAQTSAQVAQDAYDSFYQNVYLPAPEPRTAELEAALAALTLANAQAQANLLTAQQGVAALMAASDTSAATAAAKAARDQAYAAYQGALSQKDALAKASSVGAALASANAAVDAAASARKMAQDALAGATILAPADGVVLFNSSSASLLGGSSLTALGGGSAAAAPSSGSLGRGSAVSPASAPFSIVSFANLAFTAQIDETDIVRVQPGMKTTITLDGLPDTPFTSEVVSVGKEAVTTPTGGTAFPVLLRFSTNGEPVLLGMNGSVEINVETIGDVLAVPVEALLQDGNVDYVFTIRGGRARRTEVKIGRFTDTLVEIVSGLEEGDTVIVSGTGKLKDGDRVRAE